MPESRITQRIIAQSHEAQFNGTDYQVAAYAVLESLPFDPTDEEIAAVESSPDPGCECPFCQTATFL